MSHVNTMRAGRIIQCCRNRGIEALRILIHSARKGRGAEALVQLQEVRVHKADHTGDDPPHEDERDEEGWHRQLDGDVHIEVDRAVLRQRPLGRWLAGPPLLAAGRVPAGPLRATATAVGTATRA
jgi:hypothetical protein